MKNNNIGLLSNTLPILLFLISSLSFSFSSFILTSSSKSLFRQYLETFYFDWGSGNTRGVLLVFSLPLLISLNVDEEVIRIVNISCNWAGGSDVSRLTNTGAYNNE